MGYTTKFTGKFMLNKPMSLSHAALIEKVNRDEIMAADWPDLPGDAGRTQPKGYFQWTVSKDRRSIEWDGSEKFYYYDEWLQWLVDKFLTPWGYSISGEVAYQGETTNDLGILKIVGGKVVKQKCTTLVWRNINKADREHCIARIQQIADKMEFCPALNAMEAAIRLLREDKQ